MKGLPTLTIVGLLMAPAFLPGQQISPNPIPAVKAAAQADSDRAAAAKQARALLDKDAVVNSSGMKLKLLPAGEFTTGSPNVLFPDEQRAHQVTRSRPFYLGVYEITQTEYQQVMGKNPSKFKGVTIPVDSVSWDEVVEFCRKLSAFPAEKAAGRVYRLPTEAEWEYACRGGEKTIGIRPKISRRLESSLTIWLGTSATPTIKLILWVRSQQTPGVFMTCTAMFGSGVRIG
ncbi:MAG: formylglycine-generating enzyme family protein [Pirellulaceae bacterium]|nr:formylglycine-generating enzyme family protein [Pirellulaceae bacterium]